MLVLNDSLTNDEEANKIIRRFVSNRILQIIQLELDMNDLGMTDDLKDFPMDNEDLYFSVTEDISPENVVMEDANRVFISLVSLLKSEQEMYPSMLQNYQIFQLICGYCDIADDIGEKTIEKIPSKDRKKVLNALEPIAEDAECQPQDIISRYENMKYYEEICFEDWDFLSLDNMTYEEIKESFANEILGLIDYEDTLGMKAQIIKFPEGHRIDE